MSKTLIFSPRSIPLDDAWDVIVVGGGPAGCTAAVAAAREGAKTLLIEATSCLGGMGTAGLVPAWCPFTNKEQIIYGGLAERILRETMQGMPHVSKDRFDWTPIDPERLKRVYDNLMLTHGVSVLFNTLLAAVDLEGDNRVGAIITASKAGLKAFSARFYVDCTGDADLAVWAGAAFEKGEPETGELQPASLCFIISNVDTYAYQFKKPERSGEGESVIDCILTSGKYPEIPDNHFCNNLLGPGMVGFNAGHIWNVDNTDPFSVSTGLMRGRKMADAFQRGLAEFFPEAFANSILSATGSLMGIRETRRIIGDYVLTLEDYLARRKFYDEICRNAYFIDVHWTHQEIDQNRQDPGWFEKKSYRYEKGESHGIPYRCLTPRGLSNVLVAGRSISTDRPVQGSTRVMPVCLALGEAAGCAAGLALQEGTTDVHQVDVFSLRSRLKQWGAYLPEVEETLPMKDRQENATKNE